MCLKRLHHPAAHRKDFRRQNRIAGCLPDAVDLPQQPEQLSPNRRVWLERELVEFPGHRFCLPMSGQVEIIRFEIFAWPSGNLNVRMPLRIRLAISRPTPTPVADRITAVLNRDFPNIPDTRLLFIEEGVLPVGRQQNE